jgi:hypothetical protein
MDEQEAREEAWQEGVSAAMKGMGLMWSLDEYPNPYTPEVECTPSHQEMNAVLLSEFTQEEIWRGERQREDQLAVLARVKVVEELESLEQRLTHTAPAAYTVGTCIRIIRDMEG